MSDVDPKTLDPLTKRLHKLTLEWSQGRVSLKEIVGLSPEELYAIANQGYLFFLQGKIQPAQVIFEGLVAIDPRNAYYYRALGAIYWQQPYRGALAVPKAIRPLQPARLLHRFAV